MIKEEVKTEERYLDILNFQGDILFSIRVREYKHEPDKGKTLVSTEHKTKSDSHNGGEPMTEPQRKLLFRIYAQKGLMGEEAHTEIKNLFGVQNLKDISKIDAMKKIDSLLKESKGGNGNGSPVK